ncbi:hypothetical protein CDIK_0419 [Cucumispora dikerogammari]|nr:hypothetical protein CDIK_0419 [Cucumispora dikerogammari]
MNINRQIFSLNLIVFALVLVVVCSIRHLKQKKSPFEQPADSAPFSETEESNVLSPDSETSGLVSKTLVINTNTVLKYNKKNEVFPSEKKQDDLKVKIASVPLKKPSFRLQKDSLLSKFVTFENPRSQKNCDYDKSTWKTLFKSHHIDKIWEFKSDTKEKTFEDFLNYEIETRLNKHKSFSLLKSLVTQAAAYYRLENNNIQRPSIPPLERNIKEPIYLKHIASEEPVLFAYLNIIKTNCRYKNFLLETHDEKMKKILIKLLSIHSDNVSIRIDENMAKDFETLIKNPEHISELQHLFLGSYELNVDDLGVKNTLKKVGSTIGAAVFDNFCYRNEPILDILSPIDTYKEINIQKMLSGLNIKCLDGKEKVVLPFFLNSSPFLTFYFQKIKECETQLTFQQEISLPSLEDIETKYYLTGFVITEEVEDFSETPSVKFFFKHDGVWKWFDNGNITALPQTDFNFKTRLNRNITFEVELFYSRVE